MDLFVITQVSVNGFISFNKEVTETYPIAFPATGLNIVSVFWNNIDITGINGGNVYLRLSKNSSDLDKATQEIRSGYADMPMFTAIWMLIVTWDRVAYYLHSDKVVTIGMQCVYYVCNACMYVTYLCT